MARVFASYDERTDRMVAVKPIDSSVNNSRISTGSNMEAWIHARLKHPNVFSLLKYNIEWRPQGDAHDPNHQTAATGRDHA